MDEAIRAELPNQEDDQELFEIVTKYLWYGPCVVLNPRLPV